ncbi:MAG: hypothetical protein TEF_11915 [Rhizobiales bacterium NRL2]|nr:MAG: hypothetical protein TEF_11915 [Rhizobiales bacterium NRL2]
MAAAGLPLFGAISVARAATPPDIRFRAIHGGTTVGEHRVQFRSDGDYLVVTTHIDITVRILFFTAFRFSHDAVEVWQSGRLISVEGTTDDNGVQLSVTGSAVEDGFRITGVDGPYLAPPQLLTTNTLWDRRLLHESRMIDVQHGGEVGLVVKPRGEEDVATPRGPVRSRRFQIITPNYAGSVFFDRNWRWVKGLMERNGEILEYALAS